MTNKKQNNKLLLFKMKKILLIADSNMSLSGVPVVFMSIVRQLKDEFLFDIIVLKDNDMFFEKEFLSYGGKIYRYNFNKPNGLLSKTKWFLRGYTKSVKDFIDKNIDLRSYSVVHSFNEDFSYPFFKEAKKAGISKRILHICSAISAYSQKLPFKRRLLNVYRKKAMKYCSDIVFVSNKSLSLNNYKNKGLVLYNIYDEKKFGNIEKCEHNRLVLTQIATFSYRKNQLFSLDVIRIIKNSYPGVILNIVGKELEDGYLNLINKYIEQNNLKENIRFLGTTIDRKQLNKETSFVIYPSTMESFGLVLIESQSCGIHCFASKGIPNDADMGNVDFLELDSVLWAKEIISYYEKNGNERKEPINKDKFSTANFKNTLLKLYN